MNSNGVTIEEAITYWKIGEARLCDETCHVEAELAKYDQDATLDTIWDSISIAAKQAVTRAWENDEDLD